MIRIFHNTRCGKSRCAFDLLTTSKKSFETIEYLKTPLLEAEIRDLLRLLNKRPLDVIRQKEPVFQENFKGKNADKAKWQGQRMAEMFQSKIEYYRNSSSIPIV